MQYQKKVVDLLACHLFIYLIYVKANWPKPSNLSRPRGDVSFKQMNLLLFD